MPAARAASSREAPSSTSARASIRREAAPSRHRLASRRRSPAPSSCRVIPTVMAPPLIGYTADQPRQAPRGSERDDVSAIRAVGISAPAAALLIVLDALDQVTELLLPLGVGRRQGGPERSLVDVSVDLHADAEQLGDCSIIIVVVVLAGQLPGEVCAIDEHLLVGSRELNVSRLRHDGGSWPIDVARQAEVLLPTEDFPVPDRADGVLLSVEGAVRQRIEERSAPGRRRDLRAEGPEGPDDDRVLRGAELEPLQVLR